MFRRLSTAAALLVALSAPAFAAERPVQAADHDAKLQLFKDVQKQVLGYAHFSIFDSVETRISDSGVVELTGKLTMPYKSSALEQRVAKVPGVSGVVNRLEVLPVSQFDDQLRLRIARAIYGNANFWGYGSMVNPPIHIIVEHGRVTLQGVVNSNVDRMLARSIASSFTTLGPVTNELKTDAEMKDVLEKL